MRAAGLHNSYPRRVLLNSPAAGVVSNNITKIIQFLIRLLTISHEVYLRSRSKGSKTLKKYIKVYDYNGIISCCQLLP